MLRGQDKRVLEIALQRKFLTSHQVEECQKMLEKTDDPLPLSELLIQLKYLSWDEWQEIERVLSGEEVGDSSQEAATVCEDSHPTPHQKNQTAAGNATLVDPSAPRDLVEKTRFGRYEIMERIAKGGMGIVYKARDSVLERKVALKTLIRGDQSSSISSQRFLIEARAAARLRHPNIVAIYDVGEEEGQYFFTMEYIEGQPFSHFLAEKPPLTQCLEIMKQVAQAVHYAHEEGIVHRDLKPSNILLDEHQRPLVMDFGLAKEVDAPSDLTKTGSTIGTPTYMAPEQAKGYLQEVDQLSDVYSLGAILYEALTRQRPYSGPSNMAIVCKVILEDPPAPREVNPAITPGMESIIQKCMAKEKEKRFTSANELVRALEDCLEGRLAEDQFLEREEQEDLSPLPEISEEKETETEGQGKKKRGILLPLLVIVLLLAGGAYLAYPYMKESLSPEWQKRLAFLEGSSNPVQAPSTDSIEGGDKEEAKDLEEKGKKPSQEKGPKGQGKDKEREKDHPRPPSKTDKGSREKRDVKDPRQKSEEDSPDNQTRSSDKRKTGEESENRPGQEPEVVEIDPKKRTENEVEKKKNSTGKGDRAKGSEKESEDDGKMGEKKDPHKLSTGERERLKEAISQLNSRSSWQRQRGKKKLQELGPKVIPSLVEILQKAKNRQIKGDAIEVLAEFGKNSKKALPSLVEILKGGNTYFRGPLIKAFGAIGPPAISPLLPLLKNHRNVNVKITILKTFASMETLPDKITSPIMDLLGHYNRHIRRYAGKVVFKMAREDKRVILRLAKALASSQLRVREEALEVLKDLGPRARPALPAIRKIAEKDRSPGLRYKAKRALQYIQ